MKESIRKIIFFCQAAMGLFGCKDFSKIKLVFESCHCINWIFQSEFLFQHGAFFSNPENCDGLCCSPVQDPLKVENECLPQGDLIINDMASGIGTLL